MDDVDFSDIDNIEEIVDIMDDKTIYNDVYEVQNLFIPVMRVAENNWSMNIQTFFLMEKVLVTLPNGGTTEVVLIYDLGSGRTVGNNIEKLDRLEIPKFTDLVLSSLNGIDKSRKRVCEINVNKQYGTCSFEVICPQDKIPTPYPQSMSTFFKVRSNKYKNFWVNDITEQDLNTLPIILLGLSDIKLFPTPTENVPKRIINTFPHIQIYESKLTGRKLAAGVTISSSQDVSGFPRKPINMIWDYQEITDDEISDPTNETIIQVNYNLDKTQTNETKDSTLELDNEFHLELNDECHSLSDIMNHHGTDIESKNLIEAIVTKDKEEHEGKDEATLCLVQQLQADIEKKVKREEQEPFKYDDDEFPPLTK